MAAITRPSPTLRTSPQLRRLGGWIPWLWPRLVHTAPASSLATEQQSARSLPSRFDTHRLESFDLWIDQQSPIWTREVRINAEAVRFIDNHAILAILKAQQSLQARDIEFQILNPSLALLVTLELTPVTTILNPTITKRPRKVLS